MRLILVLHKIHSFNILNKVIILYIKTKIYPFNFVLYILPVFRSIGFEEM